MKNGLKYMRKRLYMRNFAALRLLLFEHKQK